MAKLVKSFLKLALNLTRISTSSTNSSCRSFHTLAWSVVGLIPLQGWTSSNHTGCRLQEKTRKWNHNRDVKQFKNDNGDKREKCQWVWRRSQRYSREEVRCSLPKPRPVYQVYWGLTRSFCGLGSRGESTPIIRSKLARKERTNLLLYQSLL